MLEKEWHRLLVTVQGVGAKAAMSILGTLGPEGVARAITLGDARAVQSAPGVGPKLAQRVILELKSKAPGVMAQGVSLSARAEVDEGVIEDIAAAEKAAATPAAKPAARKSTVPDAGAARRAGYTADALSALLNLGYGQGDAAQAVATIASEEPEADTATLIRKALRLLAPKEGGAAPIACGSPPEYFKKVQICAYGAGAALTIACASPYSEQDRSDGQ